ncbi:MAG: phosphoribosyltransferase [Chitinophagales bacterium]|nr:phosphoribosyltransferase [Chitinophagales bacterium]
MKRVSILNSGDIQQKTVRIAYQIVENNYDEKELILVGIKPNGLKYASQLKKQIESINGIKVRLIALSLNKDNPLGQEIVLEDTVSLNGKTVIVVDDVANTGKTMYYALKPIMEFSPKKVQAVVLVDRQHKLFPVTPDFVGLSLSTTLQEHILVEFKEKGESAAYLM